MQNKLKEGPTSICYDIMNRHKRYENKSLEKATTVMSVERQPARMLKLREEASPQLSDS